MKQALTWVIAVLIFVVPSNLFLKLAVEDAYIQGILVDYLITKVYLSDIVIAAFLALAIKQYGWPSFKSLTQTLASKVLILFAGILVLIQAFSPLPLISYFYVFTLLKIGLVLLYLKKCTFLHKSRLIHLTIIGTIIFQSLVGLYQFITEQSVFGYWFFGEPELSYTLGLAREQVGTVEKLLPYGTTAHPNLLGGLLSIYLLISLRLHTLKTLPRWYQLLYLLSIVLGCITLWATQSITAWTSFIIGLCCLLVARYRSKIQVTYFLALLYTLVLVTPVLLQNFTRSGLLAPSTSVYRRLYLYEAADRMYQSHLFTGVGLQQFTVVLNQFSPSSEVVRFIQPVHNVPMLWLAETGLVGLAILILLVLVTSQAQAKSSVLILALLPLLTLDHYLITLQSGLLLLVVAGVFFSAAETHTLRN